MSIPKKYDAQTATPEHRAKPRICWLGGWAVAEQEMLAIAQQLIPQAEHRVLLPTQSALDTLRNTLADETKTNDNATGTNTSAEILAGYSTGAFLLLRELETLAPYLSHKRPLLLFAPFADFRAESGLGGRVVTTRLKLLLRRLRNDPLAAIADFYQQSGITLEPPAKLPYAQADLIWGIEQLAQTAVATQTLEALQHSDAHGNNGAQIRAWIGANDALLDAQKIADLFAHGTCHVAENASHDFASLLTAANTEGTLLP